MLFSLSFGERENKSRICIGAKESWEHEEVASLSKFQLTTVQQSNKLSIIKVIATLTDIQLNIFLMARIVPYTDFEFRNV